LYIFTPLFRGFKLSSSLLTQPEPAGQGTNLDIANVLGVHLGPCHDLNNLASGFRGVLKGMTMGEKPWVKKSLLVGGFNQPL